MAYSTINKPSDYFNTKLYSGTNTPQSITGVGFQPDWTWIKVRNVADNHFIYDSVRGATKFVHSDLSNAEGTLANGLTSFNSDGFSLGDSGSTNNASNTFASWNWKANGTASSNTDGSITSSVSANTTSGFSIVSYTGTGSSSTTGHGLNSAPEIMFSKSRTAVQNWSVHTTIIDGSFDYLVLNDTNAKADSGFTAPTSTVIPTRVGSDYISYNFHSVKGFSKFGTYTGNADADGPFIYTGFKPSFVMIKKYSGTGHWMMMDNARNTFNEIGERLKANATDAGADASYQDHLSNGFKIRTNADSWNGSGANYIYMAFAEAPLVGTNNIPATAR